MPRSRGIVSRAASALMFLGAAMALLVFPEGEAGVSRIGFAPAQVPDDLLSETVGYDPADPRFRTAELCTELGGDINTPSNNQPPVCQNVDTVGTFCIVGSTDAFPCRGLYKHVILCNAKYNRPARDPFTCEAVCASEDPNTTLKARGKNCEQVVNPDDVIPAAQRTFERVVAEGFVGVAHTFNINQSYGLFFENNPQYEGFTIVAAEESSKNLIVEVSPPLGAENIATLVVGKIECDAEPGCYPHPVTLELDITVLARPAQTGGSAEGGTEVSSANVTLVAPPRPGAFSIIEVLYDGGQVRTLHVDEATGALSGVAEEAPGEYVVVAEYASTSSDPAESFLGPMRLSLTLTITSAFELLPSEAGVTERGRDVVVAPGYAGSVAFYAAASVGVTLRTPDSAPEGFGFETSAEFVAPDGFAVSLTIAAAAEEAREESFRITAKQSGYLDTPIFLSVGVSALARPATVFPPLVVRPARISGPALATIRVPNIDSALLDFAEHSDSANIFGVNGDNGEVSFSTDDVVELGEYDYTVAVSRKSSAGEREAFLGTLFAPVRVSIFDLLPQAQIFGFDEGTILTFFAAADYAGEITQISPARPDIVTLTFPEGGRTDFGDFGYDYDANILSRVAPLGANERGTIVVSLIATRQGYYLPVPVSLGVVLAGLGELSPILPVPATADATGEFYDFGTGKLAGARFARTTPLLSPELTISADGVVSAPSALGGPGSLYTLRASAEGDDFLGTALVSLTVTITDLPVRRGLFFRRQAGQCSDLGAGWRRPNLAEAAGLLREGDAVTIFAPAGADFPGMVEAGVSAALVSLEGGDADSPQIGGALRSGVFGYGTRGEAGTFATLSVAPRGEEGIDARIEASPDDYCARPADGGGYTQPADPAGLRLNRVAADENGGVEATLFGVSTEADYGLVTLEAWRYDETGGAVAAANAGGVEVSLDAESGAVLRVAESGEGRAVLGLRAPGGGTVVATLTAFPQSGRTITARVELILLRALNPDDVVAAAMREVSLYAVEGYYGPAVSLVVGEGYALEDAPEITPDGAGGYDPARAVISIPEASPFGTGALTLAMEADVLCPTPDDYCAPLEVSVTVVISPAAGPRQATLEAVYAGNFAHSPALPVGFESGATLSIAGVAGNSSVDSFALANGQIVPAAGADAPDAGSYEISLAMTRGDLLGTLTLTVPAEIEPAALDESFAISGLTPDAVVTVAAGYDGAVHVASLAAASAVVAPPSFVPAAFTLAFSADSRRVTVLLASALAGGERRTRPIELTVIRQTPDDTADANYRPLPQTLFVTVQALAELDSAFVIGRTVYAANNNIYDFRAALGGVYAEATFEKEGGAAELVVSPEGVVSNPADILAAGSYTLTVRATRPGAYLGGALAEFVLALSHPTRLQYGASVDGRGTLTVSGIPSGGEAILGAEVTFVATPAEFYYVSGWSDARCPAGVENPTSADTGPGNAVECVVAADTLGTFEMTVSFESVYPIRRGLELNAEARGDSGACEAGEGGWREPNLAEALGLVTDGESAQVSSRATGAVFPGVPSAPGVANVALAPLRVGDSPPLTEHPHRASFYGMQTDDGVVRMAGVGADENGAYATFGSTDADYCVRPLREGYVRPLDPAAVCITPDCAEAIQIAPQIGARATVTVFAWRLDSSGQTVAAGGAFSVTLSHQSGPALDVETIGNYAGGARTVALIPRETLPKGEVARVRATPQVGAAVGFDIARLPPDPVAIPEAAGIPAAHRDVTLAVAPDYDGLLHQAAPAAADVAISATVVSHPVFDQFFNIVGSVTVTLNAASHSETGVFRVELTEGRTLNIEMISTLPERTVVSDVFRVTLVGVEERVYVPRGEEISLRVSVLVSAPGRADFVFDSSDARARGGSVIHDFGEAAPGYAGAAFSRSGGAAELIVTPAGEVRTADGEVLAGGFRYEIAAGATGSPANPFLGSAAFSARADVYLSAAEIAAALPASEPRVFAVQGYRGGVYTLTLAAEGPVLEATYPFAGATPEGFALDGAGAVALTLALTPEGAGGVFAVRLTRAGSPIYSDALVSLSVVALSPPAQSPWLATISTEGAFSGAAHPILYPQGFAAEGYQTEILGVSGGETDNFALTVGGLVVGENAPAAGEYEITLGISHSGFLGTLAAAVSARALVGEYGDIDDGDEVQPSALSVLARVAPLYAGEVHRIAAAGSNVELLPPSVPQGFAARGEGSGALAFFLTAPLGSSGVAALTATVTQVSGSVFEDVTVVVSLTALASPRELDLTLSAAEAEVGALVTMLRIPDVSNIYLDFAEHSDSSDSFTVDNDGTDKGAVLLSRELAAGADVGYTVAISPDRNFADLANFVGTLYYPLRLRVAGILTPALALPDSGNTISFRAAAGFAGTVVSFAERAGVDVALSFPDDARAAFDARSDFGYDYAANALIRKSPFPADGRETVILTLLAERVNYLPLTVEVPVTVAMEAFSLAGATVTVAEGMAGPVYDLNSIESGADFRREPGSSPALTLSALGIVSALEPLRPVGLRRTIFVSAARPDRFLGRVNFSLVAEVGNIPVRRGLRYQAHSGACPALGTGWRMPNLAEAAGFLFDPADDLVGVRAQEDVIFSGLSDSVAATLALTPKAAGDEEKLDGVWLEADFAGRNVGEINAFRAAIRADGAGTGGVVVLPETGDATTRYCVTPVDAGSYVQPADPAHLCLLTDGDPSACGRTAQFPGAQTGEVFNVLIRAARLLPGAGATYSGTVRADYAISLASLAGPEGLFGAEAAGPAADGVLTIRVSLLRNLSFGEVAAGTLRVAPQAGLARDFSALFNVSGFTRRGLRFQRLEPADVRAGETCDSLGSDWRLPNLTEAAGLFMDGFQLTVHARSGSRIPGISTAPNVAVGAQVGLVFGLDNAPALDATGLTLATDMFGRASSSGRVGPLALARASEVSGISATQGLAAVAADNPEVYCVRPGTQFYGQPQDPAAVCLLPDCASSLRLSGRTADTTATVTIFAWRYDSTGATVSVTSPFRIDLRHSSGVEMESAVVSSGDGVIRGALTVSLSPREDRAQLETADYLIVPHAGQTADFRFEFPADSYAPFGGQERAPGDVFGVTYPRDDYGAIIFTFPREVVNLTYLGARRGLHYVRSLGSLDDRYVFTVCETGGPGWRPPSLGELGALFADADEGFLTDDESRSSRFENGILRGARRGTRIPFPSASSPEIPAVSGGDALAHYADAIQNRPGTGRHGALQAFRILEDSGAGVQLSLTWPSAGTVERRAVCVLPLSEEYQPPARLAQAQVYDRAAAQSATFFRKVSGAEAFHQFQIAPVRHARNRNGPGFSNQRLDQAMTVLLKGGAGLFAATVSEPDDLELRTVRVSQTRPLVAGQHTLTLEMPPAVGGVTVSLTVSVWIPGWLRGVLEFSGYVAGGAALPLAEDAAEYGLTLAPQGGVPSASGFQVFSGAGGGVFALGAASGNPLGRETRRGVLTMTVVESASGLSAPTTISASFAMSQIYAPTPEAQETHSAEAGELFNATLRYLDAQSAAGLEAEGIAPFHPRDAGARATIVGVAGVPDGATFFVLNSEHRLEVLPGVAPPGSYTATIAFSHPGFAGTLSVAVPATVRDFTRRTFDPDDFVPARDITIAVGYRYFGPLFTLTSEIDDTGFIALSLAAPETSASPEEIFSVSQPDDGSAAVLSVPEDSPIPTSDINAPGNRLAVIRASVSHLFYAEPGAPLITASLHGTPEREIVVSPPAGEITVTVRALGVPRPSTLSGWMTLGTNLPDWRFDFVSPRDELRRRHFQWHPEIQASVAGTGEAADLFRFESARGVALQLKEGVTRATLAALLAGRDEITINVRAIALGEGDAEENTFLGQVPADARIWIGAETPVFNPDDFVSPRQVTFTVAPDFARGRDADGTPYWLTVVFPPGADWSLALDRQDTFWRSEATLRAINFETSTGYRLGFETGTGFPAARETVKGEYVFDATYPPDYRAGSGLVEYGKVTLELAVSAIAAIPTGRVEYAATTRVSTLVDSDTGATVIYDGLPGALAAYSEVSLRLPTGADVNDSEVQRRFSLDSRGRIIWSPLTMYAGEEGFTRHLDARVLEFEGFQVYEIVVEALSPDYLGALRLTVEALFRGGDIAGEPRLPTGIPETGDIEGGFNDAARAHCAAFGGSVLDTPDPAEEAEYRSQAEEFAREESARLGETVAPDYTLADLYASTPSLYERCADLDNYGSECEFGVEGCGDYFARVRDCNAQNRPSNSVDPILNFGVDLCGAVCEDGLSARGRNCNILAFYGREITVGVAGQSVAVEAAAHSLADDARAEFGGLSRGLWLVSVFAETGGGGLADAALAAGNAGLVRDFCRSAGAGWRLPNLSEAAGIVYEGAEVRTNIEVNGIELLAAQAELTPEAEGIPGLERPALVYFHPDAGGNAAAPGEGVNVISGLPALSGGSPRFVLARRESAGLRASVGDSGGLVCARETAAIPCRPTPPASG